MPRRFLLALALLALVRCTPIAPDARTVLEAQLPEHPLDPLTMKEYRTVHEVLKSSGHVNEQSRFLRVRLHEPPKSEVLNWNPSESFRREAFVAIKQGPRTFEAIVDLLGWEVTTWREVEGMHPPSLELGALVETIKKNPDWQAAMYKRGITDFEPVRFVSMAQAYPTNAVEEGRNLVEVVSFDQRGVTNYYGRPIEGLVVIVDANELEVLKVIDSGVVPIPKGPVDFDENSVGKLREVPTPISMAQPLGPSFQVEGHQVSWQKWNFHFRIDPRVGLIISHVRYNDGGKLRSVLYQGSLSEIYVPYMDPGLGWNNRLPLDVAAGVGGFASPLEPGLDCPDNAAFFDAVVADPLGIPQPILHAACLFERYDGSMAWRHKANQTESRRRRDLVFRMISTAGNYDYVFDWVFHQDGTIRVAVGSTGIPLVKAVAGRTAIADNGSPATRYGRFVAENTLGVNHDHYFIFRLDLDVDGGNNSLLREELKTVRLAEDNLRKRVWVIDPKIAQVEQDAKLRINLEKPALWRVINPNVLGPLGYPVSYQIKPLGNVLPVVAPEDFPQRRGGFTQYHLWVTPYRADEQHAAGAYPLYYKGEEGLPKWTQANRPIENTDIVVWYTLGFHHVMRAEDWPIVPTSWQEFELRPFDFFERNPALDLPK